VETALDPGGGVMAPRKEHGSTLSARRAFVVHLGADGHPRRRRFSGRVEHLASGASAHFSSLKALLAFFAAVPDVAAGAAPPGGPGGQRSQPRSDRS
jgi:hypothetical protein